MMRNIYPLLFAVLFVTHATGQVDAGRDKDET